MRLCSSLWLPLRSSARPLHCVVPAPLLAFLLGRHAKGDVRLWLRQRRLSDPNTERIATIQPGKTPPDALRRQSRRSLSLLRYALKSRSTNAECGRAHHHTDTLLSMQGCTWHAAHHSTQTEQSHYHSAANISHREAQWLRRAEGQELASRPQTHTSQHRALRFSLLLACRLQQTIKQDMIQNNKISSRKSPRACR